MGFLSKAFKGLKKAVKKVAKGVKKTASKVWGAAQRVTKKITHKIGLGKVWDATSKVGKKLQSGFAKFANKIGPVGMIALSFVLGPAIGALWGAFGAGAAGMAASMNPLIAALGNAGTAVFNGVNFVGGTLGAMGSAITEGASNLMTGNFAAAGNAFTSNLASAFSGEAGSAVMNKMAAQAAASAGTTAGTSAVVNAEVGTIGPEIPLDKSFNPTAESLLEGTSADSTFFKGTSDEIFGESLIGDTVTGAPTVDTVLPPATAQAPSVPMNLTESQVAQVDTEIFGKPIAEQTLADQATFTKFGKAGVEGINTPQVQQPIDTDALKDLGKSLLGKGEAQSEGFQGSQYKTGQAANLANWTEAEWLRYQQAQRQQFNLI